MIKAILFDLDGVLVDAVDIHQKAFLEAVKPYKEISEEFHMQYLNGLPTKKKLEKLGFNTDIIDEINKKKQDLTFGLIKDNIRPVEQVTKVIAEIKSRGIKFAVCSNSIRKTIELFLEAIGLTGYEFIISNQDVINPKPHPEMYLKGIKNMNLLGISQDEILIVEDSPVGIESAEKSGSKVCRIKNPYDIEKVIIELNLGEIQDKTEKTLVITHRGLEPSNPNFYSESSFKAFKSHLERGFGIEFDVNFAKDGIVIFHDAGLSRITEGRDERQFRDLMVSEIKTILLGRKMNNIPSFEEILNLIKKNKPEINALHLKGKYQEKNYLDILLNHLRKYPEVIKKIVLFDVKPEAARYLKSQIKDIQLAPSVAHEFDIKRYSSCVSNTLISIGEAIRYKQEGLYDWAWLDEWDTLSEGEQEKLLYTKENFESLKKAGYKIALVTPELHGTSPGLYGGESHKHARDKEVLFKRIKEILTLEPDAICTDYPEEVKSFM